MRPRSALRTVSAPWRLLVCMALIAGCRSLLRRCLRRDSASCGLCSQPRAARVVRSVRRQATQQGMPTRLCASHNRGGVPELGGHRRQVVRWQCDRCDPASRLFLAQRRRRRLPQHSLGWQCEPHCTAAVRRCAPSRAATHPNARGTKNRAPHPRTRTRPATARVGARALRHCELLRRQIRLRVCDCECAGPSATAPTLSPPGGTAARRSASLHSAWPARPGHMRRAARICATCHAAWWCPECRAAFEIGGTNSNDCPQSYSRLETEAACKSLAAIAGVSMDANSQAYKYYPAGCFWHTVNGKFYWNTHGSGASSSFAQPLCAGAPARPAPPPECVFKWLRVHASHYLVLGYSVPRPQAVLAYSGGSRVLAIKAVLAYSALRRCCLLGAQAVQANSPFRR
jgi:hypothetical protein